MKSDIGICRLIVKRCKTDEKCYMYMQFGGGKEKKKTVKGDICVCGLMELPHRTNLT
jgi:ligand-binding sensor protein